MSRNDLKIDYLHQYFNTPAMPGGTRSYEMARRLVGAGHEVHVITTDSRPDDARPRRAYSGCEDGISVYWLPVPYSNQMSYARRIRAFLAFAVRSAQQAAALDADVIFATSTPLTVALPAVYAAKCRGIPMVFEVRDLWPEVPIAIGALRNRAVIGLARWLERFAYRNASRVVALSPGIRDGILRTGYPENRVAVIPNSSDIELFSVPAGEGASFRRKHEWLGARPLVLYAGAVGLINGLEYMVRLAAETAKRDPEIRFLVVGTGREEGKVRDLAAALNVLDKSFFMLPPVPKGRMPILLSACTIATSFVIDVKETWDNSANKFFDALAAGKPIAINHGGWLAQLIEESGAGMVLDARDVAVSAERLVSRIRDEEWLRRTGAAGRGLAETRFSRDVLARQLEGVLVSAVEEARGQR